jgi:predicted dehydrogenase
MLKVGLIGLGFMGRGHLSNYKRLEAEGSPVKLVAVCDIDPAKLEGRDIITGNLGVGNACDLSGYAKYTDYNEMLAKEALDYVDIALPTYLHAQAAIAAMQAGCHVLSEKPMARTVEECEEMIEASRSTGKKLMTAQCLRFWPAYEFLKECVDDGRFGKVTSANFFRGGSTPQWSWEGWMLDEARSGGCLLDQHIHDVDMVNWLFGPPDAVSTCALNVVEGSGYDAVSTHYHYSDGKVVCAEDDWTINGEYGFDMQIRVNFRRGSVHFSKGALRVCPADGAAFTPELCSDDGYYRELNAFIRSILDGTEIERCTPESTRDTIAIALAEVDSADRNGAVVKL